MAPSARLGAPRPAVGSRAGASDDTGSAHPPLRIPNSGTPWVFRIQNVPSSFRTCVVSSFASLASLREENRLLLLIPHSAFYIGEIPHSACLRLPVAFATQTGAVTHRQAFRN